ncbi:MAG: endonuclease/exonuclease/phosphatase family protein [Candidatus Micrarchaeota archaeon]
MGRRKKLAAGPIAALLLMLALIVIYALIQPPASGIQSPENQNPEPANRTQNPEPATNQSPSGTGDNETQTTGPETQNATLTIATFNIQVFGESKRSKPGVMDVLTTIARRYDFMAIQEIRDSSETTLPIYLEQINALPGPDYEAISSPRLGRTSSKENYAFIYDPEVLSLIPGTDYTFQDPPEGASTDLFQREPFIARFEKIDGSFDFVIITIHTDPDETPQELSDLPLVLQDAMERFPDEDDFIMLGDMNADCSYLSQSYPLELRNSSFTWVVPDDADTTVKSTDCAYDRIIFTRATDDDFTGEWGIFRFDEEYGLNESQAEEVSDHYPVWARFG